jgi:hypothetical protein
MTRKRPSAADMRFGQVFGVPALLALVSVVGLLSALLGDGVWDAVSWVGLGALIAVIGWHVARPGKVNRKAGGRT